MATGKMMSAGEVSKRTGLSMRRVRQAAVSYGVLKVANSYLWTEEEVRRLEKGMRKPRTS